MTPFEVLQQDIDDFILIANYLISLSERDNEETKQTSQNTNVTEKENDRQFWSFI